MLVTKKNDSLSFYFLTFFLVATVLLLSSELILVGLLNTGDYNSFTSIGAASLGNILDSAFNLFLGFYLYKYIDKKWFLFKKIQIKTASKRFKKFETLSLLFARMPVIVDLLTFLTGILRINFLLFLFLVAVEKISRYFFIYTMVN